MKPNYIYGFSENDFSGEITRRNIIILALAFLVALPGFAFKSSYEVPLEPIEKKYKKKNPYKPED